MDDKHINGTLPIERYLQGDMSDEEAASFEELYLSSDQLLDELETAERLQQGLKDVVALEKANESAREPRTGGLALAGNVASIFQSPRYAMAASFLLVVSLGVSGFLFQRNIQFGEISEGLAVPAEIMPLVTVRGAAGSEPVNTLQLGDTAQQFVLMLDPGYEAYSHFRATVFSLDSADQPVQLWQVDDMAPGFEDMLALSLPGAVLRPGDFEIRVEGWRDEWSVDHSFDTVSTIPFTCIDK
jgi:hypothetical protein